MKNRSAILALTLAATTAFLPSCVTIETVTATPDGAVTRTRVTGPAPGAVEAISEAVTREVLSEK